MEILGIGINELIFILIIALLVLGPKDMQKTGKTIGRWLRDISQSEGWRIFRQTSLKIREMPKELIKEANMELTEINKQIKTASSVTSTGSANQKQTRSPQPYADKPVAQPENKISPTESEPKESESDQPNNA
ncbi:MAG: twin-arginine translocase TatA/TatE family subunit [Anaerolineales bacterium]|nr:twin-arginine translocase TatA/TatE family subunit [Anaerolineales bacterium]MBX3038959.1 twin-arginine translocase TatA/TatE family subunit [Anaerolineales bacterium]